MKIHIENLGPVKSADITLKDLTIFIGKNNTGKTWTASAICGLLDKKALHSFSKDLIDHPDKYTESFEEIIGLSDKLIKNRAVSFNIVEYVSNNIEKYYNILSDISKEWLAPIIGTSEKIFSDVQIQFSIDNHQQEILETIRKKRIDNIYASAPDFPAIRILKDKDKDDIIITIQENNKAIQFPDNVIQEYFYNEMLGLIHLSIATSIHYLPAERTGVIAFLDAVSPQASNTARETNNGHVLLFSQPIVEMLGELKWLMNSRVVNALTNFRKENDSQKYVKLAEILESEVLEGHIHCQEKQDLNTVALRYQPNVETNSSLELSIASSTVKDLVPLVLYLRYLIDDNDLVFIDEPEMNLHPENQAKFMEFITLLVNSGIKVFMITHSPYMVNHLESLMTAYQNPDKENLGDKFYLRNMNSIINPDRVSVYLFEDGVAKDIQNCADIDLGTYDNVAEKITDIYVEV